MVLNGVQNSCGNNSNNKCATCNLKFLCSKSPHCKITHIDDNFDAISRFISGFYNQYQNDITIEKEIFTQIQQNDSTQEIKITEIKNDYDNKFMELTNKLDQIITWLKNTEINHTTQDINSVEVVDENAIELYDNSKKYVEKKTLLGKTKLVEEK